MTSLLDLPAGVGQRAESVRYDLVDGNGVRLGELHPADSTQPQLTVASNASIIKTLRNVAFDSRELAEVNTFRHRLRPWWVLEDGSQYPLGEFFFTDAPAPLGTGPQVISTTLFDGLTRLDIPSDRTYGIATGASIHDFVVDVALKLGIDTSRVSPSAAVAQLPVTWPVGTNVREIIKQACALAGFLPPYFANDGYLTIRTADQLTPGAGAITYDEKNARVVSGTGVYDANLLSAPNEFVVVASGSTSGEIVGRAYVAPTAPHSKENRGYVVPKVYQEQGINDTATAQRMAEGYAAAAPNSYETVSFTSAPDPRHDVFTLVNFYGVTYRELSHTLTLEPGGTHSHSCAKVIQ